MELNEKDFEKLMKLIETISGDSTVHIASLEKVKEALGDKGKVIKAVHDNLSKHVVDAVVEFHMNNNESDFKRDYSMMMATLCGLLSEGKIILKKEVK